MSEVKTYAVNCNDAWLNTEGDDISDQYVKYKDHQEVVAALEAKCAALAAENEGLKSSRAVLSENAPEACNAIASAGFRNEAIMRGLYASTGNWNKYPKPIATLVDEALREVQTPATDAFLDEVRAAAVDEVCLKISNAIIDCYQDEIVGLDEAATICCKFADQLRKGVEEK